MNQEREKKARRRRASRRIKETTKKTVFKGLPYSRFNIWLLVIGIGLAVFGLLFLYTGDTVISTIAMVLGYTVIIPLALLWMPKKGSSTNSQSPKAPGRQQQP